MRRLPVLILLLVVYCSPILRAQSPPAFSFEIKKPKNLEDKQLPSEKTGDKKFTLPRRVYQNTVTHYNWYFNGKEKLKEILARAKDAHKDDYTQLLSFYNYTNEQTARDSIELDSVIIKANSGILLHDLRNDWIDNLYLLMGKAYFYKGIYDTAFMNLQYINYAFAPKEKDGYDKLIGSNSNEGGNAFSISSPETKNLFKKIISHTPSRNESFIWQIRTFIARQEYTEAASMIETLKSDPQFPQRLRTSISEMQALWFYEQHIYDSAARHLEDALPNAFNHEEKARWEYLIGQMYELSKRPDLARNFFERAVNHTLNPILEVYSRLNVIRQNRGDDKIITENIASLVRMARKDRYTNYRDIIYFAAAQMELERSNVAGAKDLLLRSTRSVTENSADPNQKSKSFLLLGDLSFNEGNYSDAKKFYDSVNVMEVVPDTEKFERRKGVLTTMAQNYDIIYRQDSLQRWADMPEIEREILLKKLAKKLRKLEGLKEEEELYIPTNTAAAANPVVATPDITDNAKGDWYFYNTSLRTKGFNEFRSTWGNRPNVDNWRRSDFVAKAVQQKFNNPETADTESADAEKESKGTTYESLLKGLPLTAESRKKSNDSIAQAKLDIGKSLMEGLEDYAAAIKTLEGFRDRFPEHPSMAKALLDLFYCYQKLGMMAEADAIKKLLQDKYKDSPQSGMLEQSTSSKKDAASTDDMTRRYEKIYTLFIEGQFQSAMAEKKAADQLYKNNYWTPQLLYIQSIYLIKERQDETALSVLSDLIKLFPGTPMAGKAERLMEVLGRRLEIENYLKDLKVDRPVEEKTVILDDTPPVIPVTPPSPAKVEVPPAVTPAPVKDTVVAVPAPPVQEIVAVQPDAVAKDTVVALPPAVTPAPVKDTVVAVPSPPVQEIVAVQPAAVAKDTVVALPPAPSKEITPPQPTKAADTVQLNPPSEPAKEMAAERKKPDSILVKEPIRKPEIKKDSVAPAMQKPAVQVAKTPAIDSPLTVITKDSAKAAPAKTKDTVITRKAPSTKDSVAKNVITKPLVVNPLKDSIPVVKKEATPQPVTPAPITSPALVNGLFLKDKESGHMVLLVLDKVDRIFVNEARNAFNRYNVQYPASRSLESLIEPLNDNIKFLVVQPFDNAVQASAYIQRVDKLAATELIPWLPREKYSFIIVNAKNLETIRSMKSVSEYISSLKQLYPE